MGQLWVLVILDHCSDEWSCWTLQSDV